MNKLMKKYTVGTALVLSVGCVALAGALVTNPLSASAAETEKPYYYYANVGESAYTALDGSLNLGAGTLQTGTAADQEKGSNAWGWTAQGTPASNGSETGNVFVNYTVGASYAFTMQEAGEYQLALLVEGTGTVTITPAQEAEETAALEGEETGRRVISQTVTLAEAGEIAVATTGYQLYALMVAPKDADVVLYAEWTNEEEGKVISYGELLEKETATEGFTSSGKSYAPVDYTNLSGGGGANVNFNGFTATGKIRGTEIAINRYFAVMPKSLEYFVNAGSVTGTTSSQWQYSDADENDPSFKYNELVWKYYRENGSTLKNDGTADQRYTSGKTWGYTTPSIRGVRSTSAYAFPFNTIRWNTDSDGTAVDGGGKLGRNIEYKLGDLTAEKEYVVYLGTRSFWHDRTCALKFNGADAGKLTITSSREIAVYKVKADASGMITVTVEGPAKQDEAILAFVAVQDPEKYTPADAPASNLTSDSVKVDITASSVEVKGAQEGAKLQIYNEARPYNVLYEEMVDPSKLGEDGAYTIDYKKPFTGVNRFIIVQLTSGGCSLGPTVSVTDIDGFKITGVDGYTSQDITLHVTANAASGIVKCTVQKDFEQVQTFDMYRVKTMNLDYVVRENGTYKFVVYSGIDGVIYSEDLVIKEIDKRAPVMTLTPTGSGWDGEAYTLRAAVNSVAPVVSYTVYKNGAEVSKGEKLPSSFSFTEKGEYEISVVTAANARATSSVLVGDAPVYTKVTKRITGKDVTLNFEAVDGYAMDSLVVYQIENGTSTRLTVIDGKELTVYDASTYVAVVKTTAGTTEMYRFEVGKEDFEKGGSPDFTGAIVAGAVAGVALAGFLATLLIVLLKKKGKNSKLPESASAAADGEDAEENYNEKRGDEDTNDEK